MLAGEAPDVRGGGESEEVFGVGEVVRATDGEDAVGEESFDCVVDGGGSALGYKCGSGGVVCIAITSTSAWIQRWVRGNYRRRNKGLQWLASSSAWRKSLHTSSSRTSFNGSESPLLTKAVIAAFVSSKLGGLNIPGASFGRSAESIIFWQAGIERDRGWAVSGEWTSGGAGIRESIVAGEEERRRRWR